MALAKGATVRLHGLQARSELNDRVGTIVLYDESKKRYAVKLDDVQAPILLKPANLQPVGIDDGGSSARRVRLQALTADAADQHALKVEAAAYTETIHAAKSRAEVDDDTWDRVVEIQALVQRACNSCNVDFPALQLECLQVDDRACWSRTSVEYAHFLLGQADSSGAPRLSEAKRLAKRVLKLHACGGANSDQCRDALLATAVLAAEGPFSQADADALLRVAPDSCPALNSGTVWADIKARDKMHRELEESWDTETHARLDAKGAAMAAAAAAGGGGGGASVGAAGANDSSVATERGDPCSASCSE